MIYLAPTLDTSAYGSGDVLFDFQALPSTLDQADRYLQSLTILDEDDQGAAMTLIFATGSGTLGTANAAPSISDANARNFCGNLAVASADYVDLGGAKVYTKTSCGLILPPGQLYVAAITGGTPTHTAAGLKFNFAILPL